MRYGELAACALLFLVLIPGRTSATPIIGGLTTVNLGAGTVAALTGAGIGVAPRLRHPRRHRRGFPITGGSIDGVTGFALIEHDGSGLSFSTSTTTLDLENFLIDTGAGLLSGQATLNGSVLGAVPLFTIDGSLGLFLMPEAAAALSAAFGLPDLTGAPIGVASVQVQAVPEPATLGLIGLGLASLAAARRAKRSPRV
jgi:hypothetical protein